MTVLRFEREIEICFEMKRVASGFVKADSGNLPLIDSFVVRNFFKEEDDFVEPEIQHGKTRK